MCSDLIRWCVSKKTFIATIIRNKCEIFYANINFITRQRHWHTHTQTHLNWNRNINIYILIHPILVTVFYGDVCAVFNSFFSISTEIETISISVYALLFPRSLCPTLFVCNTHCTIYMEDSEFNFKSVLEKEKPYSHLLIIERYITGVEFLD